MTWQLRRVNRKCKKVSLHIKLQESCEDLEEAEQQRSSQLEFKYTIKPTVSAKHHYGSGNQLRTTVKCSTKIWGIIVEEW